MNEKFCTLCGSNEHTAKDCPWRVMSLRQQSRKASFAEAVANTLIGLLIAFWATHLICRLNGIPMSWSDNFVLTGWMTVVSVLRGYVLRRAWNSEFWKSWKKSWQMAFLMWKYRKMDPDLCCCGRVMSMVDNVCEDHGCRSAKEYAITQELQS